MLVDKKRMFVTRIVTLKREREKYKSTRVLLFQNLKKATYIYLNVYSRFNSEYTIAIKSMVFHFPLFSFNSPLFVKLFN